MYTAATKLPQLNFAQWSRPDAENPRLASPISATSTTLVFTSAPLDYLGAVITGDFLMRSTNTSNYTELMYVPAGGMSVDGLTATGVVRGVRISGLDYTTGDSSYAAVHEGDSSVGFAISAVYESILAGVFKGTIATNGLALRIGDGTDSNTTIYASGIAETGWLRRNATTDKAEYSNDGTNWITFDSVSASNLVVASSTDTSAGTLDAKLTVSSGAGATVTKSLVNPAGNESINIDVALDTATLDTIADRDDSYTPAYLTSGANVFSTFNLWVGVTAGSFQITIDGAALDITGIDCSAVTSMGDVALVLQAAIRAESGGVETVTWGGGDIVIHSGDVTSSSAITVTTAGTAGTDISGAGANSYLDCDAGNGTATATALNVAGDAGKLVELDTGGYINPDLLQGAPTVYTANDTWTKPTGIVGITVEMWGAGGGSGAGDNATEEGGGGGGGSYAKKYFAAADLAATEAIVIGAGGVGGVAFTNNGAVGGNSTFGTTKLIAYGGGGGAAGDSTGGGGGGGGGMLEVGTNSTDVNGVVGGLPRDVFAATTYGAKETMNINGGGGGGTAGAGAPADNGGNSTIGGGGGGGGATGDGGHSFFGGGGGAAQTGSIGTSSYGGDGGKNSAGVAPGGGGGAGATSATGYDGARGQAIITEFY